MILKYTKALIKGLLCIIGRISPKISFPAWADLSGIPIMFLQKNNLQHRVELSEEKET